MYAISRWGAAETVSSHQHAVGNTASQAERREPPRAAKASAVQWLTGLLSVVLLVGGVVLVAFSLGAFDRGPDTAALTTSTIPAQYDQDRAFGYLVRLCEFGPRPSGSPAMQRQQDFLADFFGDRGAEVRFQRKMIRHPQTGEPVEMANLIASWYPERPKRYLLCAHYDTRPFPDRDPNDPHGIFVGANDGASGTAALMELAHHSDDLPEDVGIDIVLFDAEEFVFDDNRDDYFLGSIYFAQVYRASSPAIPYQAGVLLDMVGDRELKIYYERNSMRYAREVTLSLWQTAADLGVRAFVPRIRHEIRDDHLPLNRIAQIPTTDIIDFDYPRPGIGAPRYWHTEQDVPRNCSGKSLAAVVWVVHQWLKGR